MNKRQAVKDWLSAHPEQENIDRHELAALLGVSPYDVTRARSDWRQATREGGGEVEGRLNEAREHDARYTQRAVLRKEAGHLKSVGLTDWRAFALGDPDVLAAIDEVGTALDALWTIVNEQCLAYELNKLQREQRVVFDNSPVGRLASRLRLSSGGQVVFRDWRLLRVSAQRVLVWQDSGVSVEITGENCCLEAAELVYKEREP